MPASLSRRSGQWPLRAPPAALTSGDVVAPCPGPNPESCLMARRLGRGEARRGSVRDGRARTDRSPVPPHHRQPVRLDLNPLGNGNNGGGKRISRGPRACQKREETRSTRPRRQGQAVTRRGVRPAGRPIRSRRARRRIARRLGAGGSPAPSRARARNAPCPSPLRHQALRRPPGGRVGLPFDQGRPQGRSLATDRPYAAWDWPVPRGPDRTIFGPSRLHTNMGGQIRAPSNPLTLRCVRSCTIMGRLAGLSSDWTRRHDPRAPAGGVRR
jgi:hypothetical protein